LRVFKRIFAAVAIGAMGALKTASAVSDVSVVSAQPTAADSKDYVQMGKSLRQEVQRIFSDLKRRHALGSLTTGNDVTDVVLKYIPVGTSFDAAEGILRSAGCRIDIHPADIPKPHRPLRPQEPVLATLVPCDNSLPHLLTDDDLLLALKEMLACLSAGGGCIISVRDYETEEHGTNIVKPYGVRTESGKRYLIFQVWDFDGEQYDLAFFFVEEDLSSSKVKTHVVRSRYYAISITRLLELMRQAGFKNVRRLDHVFYQPVLVGTRGE
jgi:hypothetical protein